MTVFLAQLAEGGGCTPSPFHTIDPIHSRYVAPSTPLYLARLPRYSNLNSPIPPLFPFSVRYTVSTCTLPYRPSPLLSVANSPLLGIYCSRLWHRVVVPARPPMQPDGPVRQQPYAMVNFILLVRDYEFGLWTVK
jgi:hypothetical protein